MCATLHTPDGQIGGYFVGYLDPSAAFSDYLTLARIGETGETYAIDGNGLLVSRSRYTETLRAAGVLSEDSTDAILHLEMRDPQQRIDAAGFDPTSLKGRPLTAAASELVVGRSGYQLDAYNDYRGVKVIGSWQWLPSLGVGLITEIDAAEAYGPLTVLRIVFIGLIGLLAVGVVVLLVVMRDPKPD